MRRALVNGDAGMVTFRDGKPFRHRQEAQGRRDRLADPARIAELDLAELGE
jgi:hypothetical protein